MVIPQLDLLDKRVNNVKRAVVLSTLCLVCLGTVMAAVYVLTFGSMMGTLRDGNNHNRILSERLDRNYLAIKELQEATKHHCKIVHGVDLNFVNPNDAGPTEGTR